MPACMKSNTRLLLPKMEEVAHLTMILRSVHRPEAFLFPWEEDDLVQALPAGIASGEELRELERFAGFLQQLFALRLLPVDDLALALGDELFAHSDAREADLAIAYQIAEHAAFLA